MYDASATPLPLFELRNIVFETDGQRFLDIPHLHFRPNGITAIMGPNGAGKSLLLRLIQHLVLPTTGTVIRDGKPLESRGCRDQAIVFQTPVLFRRTAEANVSYILKSRRHPVADAATLLDRVGLSAKANTPARRLSGGEKQRLAIAMALAIRPRILLLDEPTASLDTASTAMIERIMTDIAASGTRIIFVSHDGEQARRLADDVVFLRNGRVTDQGEVSPMTPELRTLRG